MARLIVPKQTCDIHLHTHQLRHVFAHQPGSEIHKNCADPILALALRKAAISKLFAALGETRKAHLAHEECMLPRVTQKVNPASPTTGHFGQVRSIIARYFPARRAMGFGKSKSVCANSSGRKPFDLAL